MSLSQYLAILKAIQRKHAGRLLRERGLRCGTGIRLGSAALKLQKANWSDGDMAQGIFFSVWVETKDLQKERFNYNIHALKLGSQKVCNVKPVAFAKSFRSKFDPAGWPNVSIDFGPQTLMQGWLPLRPLTFQKDVVGLIEQFALVQPVIDGLLIPAKD